MATIELRRGTAAEWTTKNPVLASGEPGWETDTKKLKIGDGSTAWNALDYYTTVEADATFIERVQDAVAGMLVEGTNVDFVYNDASGTLTANITASGGDVELMRDTLGAALVGIGRVTVTPNDGADTIVISVSPPDWTEIATKPANVTALGALVGAADKLAYFTGSGLMALTGLSSLARTIIARTTAAAMRTDLDVYSKAEAAALLSGSEMAYAERTSNFTTTNITYGSVAAASLITGLQITVVGEGKAVDLECIIPSLAINIANGMAGAYFVRDGGITAPGGGFLGTAFLHTSASVGGSLHLKRRVMLTNGVSYTFKVGVYGKSAGTVTVAASSDIPVQLMATRR